MRAITSLVLLITLEFMISCVLAGPSLLDKIRDDQDLSEVNEKLLNDESFVCFIFFFFHSRYCKYLLLRASTKCPCEYLFVSCDRRLTKSSWIVKFHFVSFLWKWKRQIREKNHLRQECERINIVVKLSEWHNV